MRYRLDFETVKLVMKYYSVLRTGEWPDPQSSESEGRTMRRARAKFEDPCMLSGEVRARVKTCGVDGLLVKERYGMGAEPPKEDGEIEKELHISLYEIPKLINRVAWYCVGYRRGYHKDKKTGEYIPMTYDEWRERNHR